MEINSSIPAFFLCANTPCGFVSRLQELTSPQLFDRVYLLKGGPGSGKSTLLKKIANAAQQKGLQPQQICCSLDPTSLDGVCFGRTAVLDATAPHTLEPKYFGAVEQVVLLDCQNTAALQAQREEMIALVAQKEQAAGRATRFLAAGENLRREMGRTIAATVDWERVSATVRQIAKEEFSPKGGAPEAKNQLSPKGGAPEAKNQLSPKGGAWDSGDENACEAPWEPQPRGQEAARLLSAFGAHGFTLLDNTVSLLANRIYCLRDDYMTVAPVLLEGLRQAALEHGFSIISCYHPLYPYDTLEQLLVPALSLAFLTETKQQRSGIKPHKRIQWERFADAEVLKGYKRRMAFSHKAADELMAQSAASLEEAALLHSRLEQMYCSSANFAAVDCITQKLLNDLQL